MFIAGLCNYAHSKESKACFIVYGMSVFSELFDISLAIIVNKNVCHRKVMF